MAQKLLKAEMTLLRTRWTKWPAERLTYTEVKKSDVKTEADAFAVGVACRLHGRSKFDLWKDNPFSGMGGVWHRGELRPANLEAAWRQGWLLVDSGKFHAPYKAA
jgi:hypothetical protein